MDQNRRILAMQFVAAAVAVGGMKTLHAADTKERKVPQVIKDWMEPWLAGGLSTAGALDKYFATLTADSTYTDPNFPKPVLASSLKEHWREEFSAYPDARFETVSLEAVSEHAWIYRWIVRGTHTGPIIGFKDVPPTGRSFTLPGCDFIELRGGKVSSDVGYFDRLTLLSQLGFTLNKPPAPGT